MNSYKANEELIEILKKNNFIETSSEIDFRKGKKSFKLSKNAKKLIHFDYSNIVIFNGIHRKEDKVEINEREFKILILYFKLKSTDLKEITRDLPFNYSYSIERFDKLKEELEVLKKLNFRKPRIAKLERIIQIYNETKL
jgi:uncharacterized protein YggU (UPF0235/DUF167 family)